MVATKSAGSMGPLASTADDGPGVGAAEGAGACDGAVGTDTGVGDGPLSRPQPATSMVQRMDWLSRVRCMTHAPRAVPSLVHQTEAHRRAKVSLRTAPRRYCGHGRTSDRLEGEARAFLGAARRATLARSHRTDGRASCPCASCSRRRSSSSPSTTSPSAPPIRWSSLASRTSSRDPQSRCWSTCGTRTGQCSVGYGPMVSPISSTLERPDTRTRWPRFA